MNEQKPSEPIAPMLVMFGALALVLFVLAAPMAGRRQVTIVPTAFPSPTAVSAQAVTVPLALDPIIVSAGQETFLATCAACHGFNAQGIPGLGKPLIGSQFVNSQSDAELVAFITRGRPIADPLNTTGATMPPKGGNGALSETNLREVVAYIRSINRPPQVAALSTAPTPSGPTAVPTVFAMPTLVGGIRPPALTAGELDLASMSGQGAYLWSCSGCHGLEGQGVPFVGPGLIGSDLLSTASTDTLYQFLADGQPFADPRQTYPHPARGGYPQLTNEQLRSIVDYLNNLQP